jgi:hypothetical protein
LATGAVIGSVAPSFWIQTLIGELPT